MDKDLTFFPLYWIYNDNWIFRTWRFNITNGWQVANFSHNGHMHFFMMGFDYNSQQAYEGMQKFNFKLDDVWSNRTNDVNQQLNFRIIGQPKWYFKVTEYWRRVYIQWWDKPNNSVFPSDKIVGKLGLKYDASHSFHTYGPFREGKSTFAYGTNACRTLPIEYWHNEEKTVRDHYLRIDPSGYHIWNNKNVDENATRMIPNSLYVGSPDNHYDYPVIYNKERNPGLPDLEFMFPTLEYQEVVQLDWERLPNAPENGDGFEIDLELPLKKSDGNTLSPFSENGNVFPPGTYCNGFEEKFPDRVLKYPDKNIDVELYSDYRDYDNIVCESDTYYIPEELLGEKVVWNVPDHLRGLEDGMWVEQFLGGVVLAKAVVTLEDNFGVRKDVTISQQQFMVTQNFEGKDQNAPS